MRDFLGTCPISLRARTVTRALLRNWPLALFCTWPEIVPVAADCATGPAGSIIDANNYACNAGVCRWLGCLSTAECVATYNSQAWTCEAAFGAIVPTCWPTCTAAAVMMSRLPA